MTTTVPFAFTIERKEFQPGKICFIKAQSFLGYSPKLEKGKAIIAYEGSRTDGPFINPLDYKRDNFTGNYINSTCRSRQPTACR